MENGKRRRVIVYQFFNSQDFTTQNRLMSPDMKRICLSRDCTRDLLKNYFVGNSEQGGEGELRDRDHCCHNCDKL